MKKNNNLVRLIFVVCALLSPSTYSQSLEHCGTIEQHESIMLNNPILQLRNSQLDSYIQSILISKEFNQFISERESAVANSSDPLFIIPIVFHIISDIEILYVQNNPQLITQQLAILNDGFRKRGVFANSNGVDTRIEFCLANFDPNHNQTSGINYIHGNFGIQGTGPFEVRNMIHWDAKSYLNIWVCELAGNTAAITSFPAD
jgi:hypothetical protein